MHPHELDLGPGSSGPSPSGQDPPKEPLEEGAPPWTVTFGDMMSLLLTFFILLFSMSELEVEKFLLASQSLREAMGGASAETATAPVQPRTLPPEPPGELPAGGMTEPLLREFVDSYLEVIRERLQRFVDENELAETVRVEKEKDGVFLRMETGTLFGSGEAVIRDDAREVLSYLSQVTRELNVEVVVAGHADDRPIRSPSFASNWELSAARAAGVARHLVEDGHPPTLIRVESYGEFRPVAPNHTPEGRAENRRVELFYSRGDIRSAALRWTADDS